MTALAQKLLLVTADDFGFDEEINRGIIEAHQRGILTHSSLMARGPAVDQAIQAARDLTRLGLGVHLTVTSPASGQPVHHGEFIKHFLARRLTPRGIAREWEDQITLLEAKGVRLTHLDSHQHLHLIPPLFPTAVRLCRAHGIPRLRIPFAHTGQGRTRLFPRLLLSANILASRLLCRGEIPYHPPRFYGFDISGRLDTARLLRIIRSLPPGCAEIMSHPGRDAQALNARHGWDYHWEQELAALTSGQVKQALLDNNVRLAYHEPGQDQAADHGQEH